jgi:hypothetical protein
MNDFEKAQKIEEAIIDFRHASMEYGVASVLGNQEQKNKYYNIMLVKQNELYKVIGDFMEQFKFTVL